MVRKKTDNHKNNNNNNNENLESLRFQNNEKKVSVLFQFSFFVSSYINLRGLFNAETKRRGII